jgi:hypothetical protein
MKSRVLIAALVLFGAVERGAAVTTAENRIETQTPPPTQPMPRRLPAPKVKTAVPAALTPSEVTVVGCLYRTADIVAAEGNAGSGAKEFILAETTVGHTGAPPASGAMYQVDKLEAAVLTPHVGKRVEVVGQIEPDAGNHQKAARSGSLNVATLPEFDAVSIREVAGACPTRPTTR